MARHQRDDRSAWEGELFRLLVENVKDYAIFIVDPEGVVRSWSHGAGRLLGYDEDEVLGRSGDRFFAPEDIREGVPRREMQEALATGRGEDDRWHVRKDGTRFWSSGVMTPLLDEGGTLRGFAKIMRDRTAWWLAEQARLGSEARRAAVLETALDGIITMDHEGKVVEFNPAAERLFGYSRAEALGGDMAGLIIPPGLRDAHHRGLARYLATGEGPVLGRRIEIEAMRADGTEFPVELSIARVPAEGPPLFIGYVRDITERKDQERRRAAQLALTRVLAEAATIRDAAPRIVEAVCEHLGWEVGGFWLVDRHDHVLRCLDVWHRPPAQVEGFEDASRGRTFPPGAGLPGRAWSTGGPIWLSDVAGDANFPRLAVAASEGLHGAFAIPIKLGPEVLGVVEFFSHEIREPDPALLEMMATLGGQIGQFVERKQVEEALRESEERFRASFDQAAVGVALVGADNRTIWANPGLCAMLGYTEAEMRQRTFIDVTHPDDIEAEFGRMPPLLEGKVTSIRYEKRYLRKDGSVVWGDLSVSMARDAAGTPKYVVGVVVDVTERKRAEEELQRVHAGLEARVAERTAELARTNEFLQALLDNIQDGIVACDAEGVLTLFNRATLEFHGLPPEPLTADRWAEHYDLYRVDGATRLPREEIPLFRALQGERVQNLEMVIAPKNGRRRTLLASGQAFYDDRGTRLGAVVSMHDISDRKYAEELLRSAHEELERRVEERTAELGRANAALQEADRRKNEFLAMLAHELRNPLAPVRNALYLLKMPGATAADKEEAAETMERQVEHLVRLVDDLLDVSRIVRDRIELRKERVDLSGVVARAVEMTRPVIDAHGHELSVSVPDGPVWLEADSIRLSQVIGNLLNNAAKYTERAGRIWLTAGREGEEAVVRVRDTGIGIGPGLLPYVFDLFVQDERSLARSQGGLGIGLTLVRRLVELHGGTVTAASPGHGRGSEFTVRLPAPSLPRIVDGSEARGGPARRPEPARRVLVVDDNVDSARSIAKILRRWGHAVQTAHDGPSALEAAAAGRPEVVLLDIGLPGMDGYEVARRLRGQPGPEPALLVAVTGYGQSEDLRRAREAGFDRHLVKPVDPDVLRALLEFADRPSGPNAPPDP